MPRAAERYDRDFCLDVIGEYVRSRGRRWRLLSISLPVCLRRGD